MMTILLSLIALLSAVAMLFFMAQILPNRLKVWHIITIGVIAAVPSVVRFFVDYGSALYLVLTLLSYPISIGFLFLFQGKIWRRFLVLIFFIAIAALSDTLVSALYVNIFHVSVTELGNNRFNITGLIAATFTLTLFILLGALTVLIWRMISARRFQPFFMLFFILPIGQLVTLYSFMFSLWTEFWLLGVIINLVAVMVLLFYTIAQEKKAALEEELMETRHIMELEQYHYREVEQRRDELAKIRHDFNNQLASVSQLIQAGNENSAKDIIKTLSEEIAGTREDTYCSIPVVNAIITEKAQDCATAGIGFKADLDFPAMLSVEQIHLCSIFGNLLDNAITACTQIEQADTPTVQVRSMVEGGYLVIKVTNPAKEPQKKQMPGHGYGSRILQDYAARYSGDYRAKYQDGIYTAMVSLLAVGAAETVNK